MYLIAVVTQRSHALVLLIASDANPAISVHDLGPTPRVVLQAFGLLLVVHGHGIDEQIQFVWFLPDLYLNNKSNN